MVILPGATGCGNDPAITQLEPVQEEELRLVCQVWTCCSENTLVMKEEFCLYWHLEEL